MSTGSTDATGFPERDRFSIPLPRPLWIALATVVLVVMAIGLGIGAPIYRQQRAIQEINRLGGSIDDAEPIGPKWLQRAIGQQRMQVFCRVRSIAFKRSRVS